MKEEMIQKLREKFLLIDKNRYGKFPAPISKMEYFLQIFHVEIEREFPDLDLADLSLAVQRGVLRPDTPLVYFPFSWKILCTTGRPFCKKPFSHSIVDSAACYDIWTAGDLEEWGWSNTVFYPNIEQDICLDEPYPPLSVDIKRVEGGKSTNVYAAQLMRIPEWHPRAGEFFAKPPLTKQMVLF